MNWDRVEGNWKEFKGKAQQKWGKLTNDDLDVVQGKRNELAGRLQQREQVQQPGGGGVGHRFSMP